MITKHYGEIAPIRLTPEILSSCGFEENLLDENNESEGVYYSLRLSEDKYCDLCLISGDKNGILEVCLFPYTDQFRYQYLHEIQNIVKDLTKKELEIKRINTPTNNC